MLTLFNCGDYINLEKGNTAVAAEFIQQAVGGSLFEIKADRRYSEDHMVLINEAKKELNAGTCVPVKEYPNLEGCDTIFLGYPNWWNRMPKVLFHLPGALRLDRQAYHPLLRTNEGSGIGDSVRDIKGICRGADIDKGASFTGSRVRASEAEIMKWAKSRL